MPLSSGIVEPTNEQGDHSIEKSTNTSPQTFAVHAEHMLSARVEGSEANSVHKDCTLIGSTSRISLKSIIDQGSFTIHVRRIIQFIFPSNKTICSKTLPKIKMFARFLTTQRPLPQPKNNILQNINCERYLMKNEFRQCFCQSLSQEK